MMGDRLPAPVRVYECENPASWHPTLHVIEGHHHPPKAYRVLLLADPNADQSWWRIVNLCGICHSEVHALLNAFVHAGGKPSGSVTRTFSPFVRKLAAEAWQHRPSDKPPYTLTSPGDVHA